MCLYITSLNSGSNGNCYYIGNTEEAVLVDAGISCRETEKRLSRLGLSPEKIKAVFISHEHTDHIRGLARLAHKYRLPVYITNHTYLKSNLSIDSTLLHFFNASETIAVRDLYIKAFPKAHDAVDPHSFMITYNSTRVGVFTDIGKTCDNLSAHFRQCHAAFLETNYDADMLENGRYPYFLKQRIRGGEGHLSNAEALELFKTCKPEFMSHLLLSHLSKENNRPELVEALFRPHAGNTKIVVASRDRESEVFKL